MRTVPALMAFVPLALVLATQVARADDDVTGVYDVKFEEVSTNCTSPLRYPHGKLTVSKKANTLTVDIDRTPLMSGIPTRGGKISAKSRSGNTMVEGMTGVFSVAGKVTPEGQLHLVMVGEYSANGKPLCTQSWNVSGPRADAPRPPAKKSSKASPAPVHRGEDDTIVGHLEYIARIGR